MTRVLHALHRAWHAVTGLVRRTACAVAAVTRRLGTRTVVIVSAAVQRLVHRWRTDLTYRRTLIAALTAITATLLPHPAAAALIGALVAERPTRPSYRVDPFDDDEDDDDPPRHRSTVWSPGPRRLWDNSFE